MKLSSSRLLALTFAIAAAATTLFGSHAGSRAWTTRAQAASPNPPLARAPHDASKQLSPADQLAWDCVPTYWWGYWTWAWQPCAWIDRSYVQGTIGAVAVGDAGGLDTQVGP